MSFKEQLDSGKFVVTAELQPPKGIDLSEVFEQAKDGKAVSMPPVFPTFRGPS